jgi:hypothetical protein
VLRNSYSALGEVECAAFGFPYANTVI